MLWDRGPRGEGREWIFSPDMSLLIGASLDARIYLLRPRDSVQQERLKGHEYGLIRFDFSPDDLNLASGVKDGVYLWQVR